jgi:hypothetical protein
VIRLARFSLIVGLLLSSATIVEVEAGEKQRAAETLSTRIDELLTQHWQQHYIEPAPAASDAEFLRRVSLDLTGRIPRVAEVRDFLADPNPHKRRQLIDRLLDDPRYVTNFTNVWRAVLLSQASAANLQPLTPYLEAWLAPKLRDNTPYDAIIRELLTIPLGDRLTSSSALGSQPTPLAFYQANELKPENLASAASRIFLGVNLECAQCHNHPFADWKQDQFWQFAGFFAGVERLRPDNAMAAAPERMDRRELKIPGTERVVAARYLDGSSPDWSPSARPREALADWMTSPQNPYFARAAANRLWAHCFGRGIIDPLDELGGRSAASHPELLDELTRQFIASGFDLKFMLRAITGSSAYQRSSQQTHASEQDRTAFARQPSRGMTPEQLFDSLVLATGCDENLRANFLVEFSYLDRPTDRQTSILQALSMMNGRLITDAAISGDNTLESVVAAPFLYRRDKVETLYLATLSRLPTDAEHTGFDAYVSDAESFEIALEDLFWALLNSAEFVLNH